MNFGPSWRGHPSCSLAGKSPVRIALSCSSFSLSYFALTLYSLLSSLLLRSLWYPREIVDGGANEDKGPRLSFARSRLRSSEAYWVQHFNSSLRFKESEAMLMSNRITQWVGEDGFMRDGKFHNKFNVMRRMSGLEAYLARANAITHSVYEYVHLSHNRDAAAEDRTITTEDSGGGGNKEGNRSSKRSRERHSIKYQSYSWRRCKI